MVSQIRAILLQVEITNMNWHVLELTARSDDVDPEVLTRAIRGALKSSGSEVFIPAVATQVGQSRIHRYLMEGYAFVRNPGPRLKNLENTRYVQSVLSGTVPDAAIEEMRRKTVVEAEQGIGVGDQVTILSGPYRNLTAHVIEEIPESNTVQVYVDLRSKQTILTLPRSFLLVTERTPLSGLFSRLTSAKMWVYGAGPVIRWTPDVSRLYECFTRLSTLYDWSLRDMVPLWRYLEGSLPIPDSVRELLLPGETRSRVLRRMVSTVTNLTRASDRSAELLTLYRFVSGYTSLDTRRSEVQAKQKSVAWLDTTVKKLSGVQAKLESLEHRFAKRIKDDEIVIQNVLVDGHNLAMRCKFAPGMSKLTAKDGRPTGVILGFLRSLGALRKRFPEARIYVAWDGSSQRRKALYPEYKAQRSPKEVTEFDQIGFLRELLPQLGVWQVTNPVEEADDLIAALVRGELSGQHNVVYSNDKDFLALVTSTTLVLLPGAGSRKEVLYTPELVQEVFGLPAERIPYFRALCGDESDNIPGVPRVPRKVLRALVQVHGSIENIYRSSLTGVSAGQYDRLRQFEPQANLNLKLLAFAEVPVNTESPDVDRLSVTERLREIDINAEAVTGGIFGS